MSRYDDVFLVEPDKGETEYLTDEDLRAAIFALSSDLEDLEAGGPPGWRRKGELDLRDLRRELDLRAEDSRDADDGK